jgi:hypothetical protein
VQSTQVASLAFGDGDLCQGTVTGAALRAVEWIDYKHGPQSPSLWVYVLSLPTLR